MIYISKSGREYGPLAVVLSVLVSFLVVTLIAGAATTITTNIVTGGTLAVTGASTLTGAQTLTGVTTHGGNVLSDTDSTDNLGATGTRWASTFSDNFTGDTITLDGETGVNIITLVTDLADALSVIDSAGDLMVFDTSTGVQTLTITPPTTITGATTLTGGVKVGSAGTAQVNQVVTTCNPIANQSITATTSAFIQCTGVTGITSSDLIFASFGTSTTPDLDDNWVIIGARASTTAEAIDIQVLNLTGSDQVMSAVSQIASSTRIFGAN